MTSYTEINQKLFELNFAKKSRMNLEAVSSLYEKLDLPDYPKVHVAGTNGKGSCVKKISSAFTASGYKCGAFSSPHISTFRERIQIDGEMISMDTVTELLSEIFDLVEANNIEVTFFEVITLLALSYFAKEKVDVAVIEVGLGGRLDATNCITPILSIITSISLDHVNLLGSTLEKIAKEKAGIIKEGVPTLIGPYASEKIIKEMAKEKGSAVIEARGQFSSYDKENQAIARKALKYLQKHFYLKEEAIEKGLKEKPPARLEEHSYLGRKLLLDMGHNEDALRRLCKEVNEKYKGSKKVVFTSMAFNHDYQKNLEILSQNADEIYFLDAKHPRLACIKDLQKVCPNGKGCKIGEISKVIEKTSEEDLILITGSIFIMSDIYKMLGKRLEEDPFMIHDGIFKDK